ncbi:MAG: DUF4249 domain-containing protein [Bacteroidales bacterium]|nr:DUF4249 domain-containing protein [Bacteroidales bacterium]
MLSACSNGFLASDNVAELVVEGWIESGHAPVVLVSSTLPVSSTPQPVSDISKHILRYAEVYIDHNGQREYLTARLTDRFTVTNYFTSPTLRGVPGDTYLLHVKWQNFEASAVCTIPEPVAIDTVFFEKALDDTSFVAKMVFHNNPGVGTLYQSFSRVGSESNAYRAVNFTTMDGSAIDDIVVETFMRPLKNIGADDVYFHPGDTLALKLATIERPMYDFWKEYANYSNSSGSILGAPKNVKGNVSGAIGYWAGYGIDIKELICE